MEWFLLEEVKKQMDAALDNGSVISFTSEDIAAFESGMNETLQVSGNTASIRIEGVLTNKRDIIAKLFGGGNTAYVDIIDALKTAEASKGVENIVLDINSPGGNISGMFATMDVIKGLSKPVKAVVHDMAASAAYGIASQADTIEAVSRASRLGSVGVALKAEVNDNEVNVSSSAAPKKTPDLRSEEGKRIIREQLDDVHQLFAEYISQGRNTDVETVNNSYGKGGVLLAEKALKAGMIDSIGLNRATNNQAASSGNKREVSMKTLSEFRASHPDLYAEAVEKGRQEERDRVESHLILGEKGDMNAAIEAIKEGSHVSEKLKAIHLAASMDNSLAAARVEENVKAGTPPPAELAGDKLADAIANDVCADLEV